MKDCCALAVPFWRSAATRPLAGCLQTPSGACGYDFVDVKHCHGYLGHEFLSAVDRPGPYGGSLENRTRFMREIVEGIRAEAPRLRPGHDGIAAGLPGLAGVALVPLITGAGTWRRDRRLRREASGAPRRGPG